MEERMICLQNRQASRQKRRRRQRTRFLHAAVWALALAGMLVLGREIFSQFRQITPLPGGLPYEAAEPAGGGQVEVIRSPLDGETLRTLQALAAQDPRVQDVIDNCREYPEDLLKMLSRNLDMLDFVLEYPEKQGQTPSARWRLGRSRSCSSTTSAGAMGPTGPAPWWSADADRRACPWWPPG